MANAPSVTTGAFTKPVGANLVVFNDVSGNPVAVSAATPLPIDVEVNLSAGISTSANQVVEIASIGATNETPAAADTSTSGLNGLFKRLLQRLTTMMSVAGTAATNVLNMQGAGYTGSCTVTRGANQTPYTAGDVVGGALTIATAGPSAGEVLLTAIRIMLNISALPTGMNTFSLVLYNVTPPSAIADNAPWTLGSGDRAAYITKIDNIQAIQNGTGTASVTAELNDIIRQVKLVGSTSLFAYLVTNAGFTPAANSETYDLKTKGILP